MSNADLAGAPRVNSLEFIDLIGTGGMSRVYKAKQKLLDRVVAVKVLSRNAIASDESLKRFQIEARLSAGLTHANIVQVLGSGVSEEGQPYLIMEYLDGKSLSQFFKEHSPLSFRQFRDIFIPLLGALDYAHTSGLIHRDIKPSNIILCTDSQGKQTVKLLDFGIAKSIADEQSGNNTMGLTATGTVVGSPSYMSPEQCQGKELDARSDLYSLACVMYEAFNGAPPFSGSTIAETMYKHINESRESTRNLSVRMEIPEILAGQLLWGLNKAPEQRPKSAASYLEKLSEALKELTLDRTPGISPGKRNHRHSALMGSGIVGFAVLCGFIAFALSRQHPPGKSVEIQSIQRKIHSPDEVYKTALDAIEIDLNPSRATELLKQGSALEKGPKRSESYYRCLARIAAYNDSLHFQTRKTEYLHKALNLVNEAIAGAKRESYAETFSEAIALKADLLFRLGRSKEALAQLKELFQLYKEQKAVSITLLCSAAKTGIDFSLDEHRLDDAREVLRFCDRLKQDRGIVLPNVFVVNTLILQARVNLASGQRQNCRQALDRAVSLLLNDHGSIEEWQRTPLWTSILDTSRDLKETKRYLSSFEQEYFKNKDLKGCYSDKLAIMQLQLILADAYLGSSREANAVALLAPIADSNLGGRKAALWKKNALKRLAQIMKGSPAGALYKKQLEELKD